VAYRFRLEAVLNYRRNLEELAQQALVEAEGLLARHLARLTELEDDLAQAIAAFEERKQRSMPAPLYALHAQGIEQREREIASQQQLVASQQLAVSKARDELLTRVQERKIMEKAREKDQANYLHEQLRKEQNEMDEQMVLRFKGQ